MATTNSTIEKIAPMFTDLLIKKIECLKTDWQKPWIASLEQGLPRNIRGTLYNGGNVLMLLFYTEFMKFTLPVFLTFNQAKEEDLSVSKGARSFPVYYWFKFVVHKETKKTIKYEEYRKLPATEQENYKVIPQMKYYNVFNIDQTDFAEKQPERYERMKKGEQPEDYSDGMIYEALDELVYLQNWYCHDAGGVKRIRIYSRGDAIRTTPSYPENVTGFFFRNYTQEYELLDTSDGNKERN